MGCRLTILLRSLLCPWLRCEEYAGRVTFDQCARACDRRSAFFIFGRRGRCGEDAGEMRCACYCETMAPPGQPERCSGRGLARHRFYNLYHNACEHELGQQAPEPAPTPAPTPEGTPEATPEATPTFFMGPEADLTFVADDFPDSPTPPPRCCCACC